MINNEEAANNAKKEGQEQEQEIKTKER